MNKKIKISETLYNEIQENMGKANYPEDIEVQLRTYEENILNGLNKHDFRTVIFFAKKALNLLQEPEELYEYNKDVMKSMEEKYGKKKAKAIYYATANKEGRDPETFKMKEEE